MKDGAVKRLIPSLGCYYPSSEALPAYHEALSARI